MYVSCIHLIEKIQECIARQDYAALAPAGTPCYSLLEENPSFRLCHLYAKICAGVTH